MDTGHYQFTVLTPSYNRAHTLRRVYASLCAQTFCNFEWLVVDDGSTDDTRTLVEAWQQRASFPIRYVWQPKKHKKSALNHGIREAKGELIVALDSDARLQANALEAMARVWRGYESVPWASYAAITGLGAFPICRRVRSGERRFR